MKKRKSETKYQAMRQKIADSLQMSHLTKKQQERILSVITKAVMARIQAVLLKELALHDKKELQSMGKASEKKILAFIEKKVAHFPELVNQVAQKAIEDFKKRAKRDNV